MYAYALEAVEQEAHSRGTSIIDAREEFHKTFSEQAHVAEAQTKSEPVAKMREQHQVQQELMAAMGMGAHG